MADDKTARDPKLVAVEAELASDRGEIYDPTSENRREVLSLGRTENVRELISLAAQRAGKPRRKSLLGMELSFSGLLRLLTFGLWKPGKDPMKDYTYEFDPRTGGQRRVYVVRDGR